MVGRQWFSLGMTAVQLVISLGLPALGNLRCSQQLMTSSCCCNLCWLYDMNSWQSAHGGSHGPSGTSWKYLDLESLEVDTGRRTWCLSWEETSPESLYHLISVLDALETKPTQDSTSRFLVSLRWQCKWLCFALVFFRRTRCVESCR